VDTSGWGNDDKFGGRQRILAEEVVERTGKAAEQEHLVKEVKRAHERDEAERGEVARRPWWRFWKR
jgi:hypothetical protein